MAAQNQKKKLLAVMQILLQKTDEKHMMTALDIRSALKSVYGIDAERKSIYADVEALMDMGIDIVQSRGRAPGYYVASRDFELPELKLLVDAVQASKFITSNKSEKLIKKLEGLTSTYEAQQLQRQVFICDRPKTENEMIFYSVDDIHKALFENVQITFQYTEWTSQKELRLKKNGEYYVVSPWALIWADENYYLVAFDKKADMLKHYRVDKMKNLSLLKEKRLGKEKFQDFDLPAFAKKTFAMYGGYDEKVSLLCRNEMAGVMIDRFGKDVMMIPVDEAHFKVSALMTVSEQFFGWITGLGLGVKIVGPKNVREEYQNYLQGILKGYGWGIGPDSSLF
ncbi:MAG: WYL domain-containing protein [Tyzzerella sp.]|nr:WYL domain-containing protein [Tyzzerella sp.]